MQGPTVARTPPTVTPRPLISKRRRSRRRRPAPPRSAWPASAPPPPPAPAAAEKPKTTKKPKQKNAPHLVDAARELRDRWLEDVNAGRFLIEPAGKYDVARLAAPVAVGTLPALAA
ncbi:MAG TPA: hypothetical protein VK324_02995 [Tepidisphaeraceae bacterium]|nr:hypothetical protein [Tepidisphaeraceae bacterium]